MNVNSFVAGSCSASLFSGSGAGITVNTLPRSAIVQDDPSKKGWVVVNADSDGSLSSEQYLSAERGGLGKSTLSAGLVGSDGSSYSSYSIPLGTAYGGTGAAITATHGAIVSSGSSLACEQPLSVGKGGTGLGDTPNQSGSTLTQGVITYQGGAAMVSATSVPPFLGGTGWTGSSSTSAFSPSAFPGPGPVVSGATAQDPFAVENPLSIAHGGTSSGADKFTTSGPVISDGTKLSSTSSLALSSGGTGSGAGSFQAGQLVTVNPSGSALVGSSCAALGVGGTGRTSYPATGGTLHYDPDSSTTALQCGVAPESVGGTGHTPAGAGLSNPWPVSGGAVYLDNTGHMTSGVLPTSAGGTGSSIAPSAGAVIVNGSGNYSSESYLNVTRGGTGVGGFASEGFVTSTSGGTGPLGVQTYPVPISKGGSGASSFSGSGAVVYSVSGSKLGVDSTVSPGVLSTQYGGTGLAKPSSAGVLTSAEAGSDSYSLSSNLPLALGGTGVSSFQEMEELSTTIRDHRPRPCSAVHFRSRWEAPTRLPWLLEEW